MPASWDSLDRFRARFRDLGLDPVVIGAFAALHYRLTQRETTDVDFLVARLADVVEVMEADGYSVTTMAEPGEEPYVVYIRGGDVSVDLLVAETDYQREAMRRAVDGVLTVEDVIVHKLIAWRPRDRDDITSILAAGHEMDADYIERWAASWEVSERWAEARTGAPNER